MRCFKMLLVGRRRPSALVAVAIAFCVRLGGSCFRLGFQHLGLHRFFRGPVLLLQGDDGRLGLCRNHAG